MPSSLSSSLINGLFEHAAEDEHMKEFMKQNYNANPSLPLGPQHKHSWANQTSQDESEGPGAACVSSPSPKAPRDFKEQASQGILFFIFLFSHIKWLYKKLDVYSICVCMEKAARMEYEILKQIKNKKKLFIYIYIYIASCKPATNTIS